MSELPEKLELGKKDNLYTIDGDNVAVVFGGTEIAAEIVRRYNAHDDLVAAVRRFKKYVVDICGQRILGQ